MMEQHKNMPGLNEVTEDLAELRRQVMESHTVEERLRGIPPEEVLEGMPPEQIVAGLKPAQRAAILELLLKDRSTK